MASSVQTLGWKLTTQSRKQRLRRGTIKPQYRIFYRELKTSMTSLTAAMWALMETQLLLYLSITSFNISTALASINALNIHPKGCFFFIRPHLFPFAFICCIPLSFLLIFHPHQPRKTNAQMHPIPKRGQGKTEPLENAIFLFLISRSIRSGQRWVPWQYVYLYIL